MKPDRWRKVDELFEAALEREPASRAAFLDEVCGSDKELRRDGFNDPATHDFECGRPQFCLVIPVDGAKEKARVTCLHHATLVGSPSLIRSETDKCG